MGLLLLPSIEAKRHIRIENLSQSEAELFIKNLEERVIASRNLKTPKTQITDAFKSYHLIDDLAYLDLDGIAEELAESKVAQHRGIRAVFVDDETDTILVGTTVVYSDKWAMIGFDDETLVEAILDYA